MKQQKLIVAARPEGAEALSPGQRPGYNGNRQGAGDRWFMAPGLRPTKTQGAALG